MAAATDSLFPLLIPFESRLIFVLNRAGAEDKKGAVVSRHTHPFYECIVITQGKVRYETGKTVLRAGKGDAVLIPPRVPHVRIAEQSLSLAAFHLMIADGGGSETLSIPKKIQVTPGPIGNLRLIDSEIRSREPGWRPLSRSVITLTLVTLLRSAFSGSGKTHRSGKQVSPLLVQALQFINDHLREEAGVREIAAACDVSERHLSRLFKKELGIPPQQYLFEKKMPLAYSTLTADKISSVRAVARSLGYHDAAYFSRVVKDYFGLSPSQIRELEG